MKNPLEYRTSVPRAWLVDLDGTLYRQKPVRLAMALELAVCGPHRIRLVQAFRRAQEALRLETSPAPAFADAPRLFSRAAQSPYDEQLRRAAEAVGQPIEAIRPLLRHWMEERPAKWLRMFRRQSLLTEIAAFRASGGKTALVSDYPAQAKLVGMGICDLFDLVVASGEPGGPTTLKPSPEGYLLAAERLRIAPADCLVIGDRHDADGEAAVRARMKFRFVS
jgi:HAD superfamily hydrolase (TIGR01549 family)